MEDRAIIEAVLAGEHEAFGKLMDRYYAMVHRVCLNMAGNVPDAEELAHDSFVEAYLKLGQLRDFDRFAGWMKTLTLNVCRMWYRQHRERFTELDDDQVAAVEEEPEDRSVYARMAHGLSNLSAPHRLVLVLHYYEELSYEEIARFLEISKGTVMSRLHRARQSLKEVMLQMDEYQDIPTVPDDKFKEVVQAEIELLLRMFHDEPKKLERLTVVLRKAPERLAELIATTEDPVANLAVLLPHLGGETIDMVLDACFCGEEPRARNAVEILKRYAARCGTSGVGDMPSRDAYAVLDRLFVHKADDEAKAALLIQMIDACTHSAVSTLFLNALMCYRGTAFPMLLERFETEDRPAQWVVQALVRMGPRFSARLLELIRSDDLQRKASGLAGFEAQARSLSAGWPWREEPTREQFLEWLRRAEKWPSLRPQDLGTDLIAQETAEAASLVTGGPAELRAQAVRILGYLQAGEHAVDIGNCLSDPDPAVRVAAIFALSEIGDTAAAEELMSIAREGLVQERAAATLALGRLRVTRAEHLLVDSIASEHQQVREAAVMALREMGTVSSQVVLQELMRGCDRKLQRLAAKAVYGGIAQRRNEPSEVDLRLAEKRRKVDPILIGIFPDAAIRFGLTELRSYDEADLTERVARVCSDHCATRRCLIELGLMTRSNGVYEFTEPGKALWRVERFICERYLDVSAECGLLNAE